MHDDHDHDLGNDAGNPWADRINEAYYDAMGAAFGQKTRERINWMCAQARGNTVLDVGCSQGIASILMAREGMRVVGLDIYPPAIEYANSERAKEIESVQDRLEFRCGELSTVDVGQFDTVVMGEVVEHQTNPYRFIREGAACVAPGGRLIVTVPFGLNPWPDHKSTVFPRDLHEAIADEFAMASIEVVDGYIRVVADRSNVAETVLDDLLVLVKETEKGALGAQVSYYSVSAASQDHAKAKAALENAGKSYRDQIAKLNVRIADLERDLAVARERAAGLEGAVGVARQAASDLSATYTEMLRATREAGEAQRADQIERIRASHLELAEVRKQQVDQVEEHARRLHEMLAESARLQHQVALFEAKLAEAKDHERDFAERERVRESELAALREAKGASAQAASALEASLKKLAVELEEAQRERAACAAELDAERSRISVLKDELLKAQQELVAIERVAVELDSERSKTGALETELARARHDLAAAHERTRSQLAELEALRESNAVHARAATGLEARLEKLVPELNEAQAKRSAHWAKLEAQREYSQQLVDLARGLQEENQRYENSIALAIGRALLALRTPAGVMNFPRAIVGVVRQARRRREGEVSFTQLQLPALRGVVLADVATRQAAPARAVAQLGEKAATHGVEEQKKKLAITGWDQPEAHGAIRVMSILDEFSRACFAPHADLVEARPDNWEGLLDKFSPRFLLAESAWRGNGGAWRYRVASTDHPPGREFAQMIAGFRKRNVPTIFWNKEDPVHFDAFLEAARRCDVILTTSAESLARYRSQTSARTEVMQFAAEDSLHNPQGSSQRNGKVCFAGSYYAEGFESRQGGQAMLLDAAKDVGLDIYDRNHRAVAPRGEFAFPEAYTQYIRGRLDFQSLSRKYREYQVFLNVNSVSDSATMFSRRVFELLACGTPVISTWSRGIEETFGSDLVWQVRDHYEAIEALRVLTTDSVEWRRRSLRGIRAVLAQHTFRHRFAQILSLVGEREPDPVQIVAVAEVATQAEADIALAAFDRQETTNDIRKQLVLACRNGLRLEGTWPSVRVLPEMYMSLAQIIDVEHKASPGAIFAILSPRAVYGRHYLLDSVLALRYSRASVVGKPLSGAEYEWGGELDYCSLAVDARALSAASIKVADVLDSKRGVALAHASKAYAADSANFAIAKSDADRHELLQCIEV